MNHFSHHSQTFIRHYHLLVMLLIPFLCSAQQQNLQELNYLFKRGEEGYQCFRIPAVVTTNQGTLLAFAEGRKNGCNDTGDIDLVMKRSKDGGNTWSQLQVIWDDAANTCGNPAPVVDRTTGDIFLLTTWNLGEDREPEIIEQTSQDSRRVFLLHSKNDGRRWSKPKEITASVKLPDWTWYATGPGSGLQIRNGKYQGRLVVACDHIEAGTKKYYSHAIYSDDHGTTWQLGGTTPKDQVNECEVVELSDQRLMLNMRNYDRSVHTRQLAYSKDGGETWEDMHHHSTLVEPICQASMLRYETEGKVYVLFSNPASKESRVNMTLRVSPDDGQTWPISQQLYVGPSAYSDLTLFPSQQIGILYEAGQDHPYEGIVWKAIGMDELLSDR